MDIFKVFLENNVLNFWRNYKILHKLREIHYHLLSELDWLSIRVPWDSSSRYIHDLYICDLSGFLYLDIYIITFKAVIDMCRKRP